MRGFISFITGLIFALGLGMSGMTKTHVVKGFLDILGSWNLNLVGVMVGAIMVHSIAFHFIKKRKSPIFDSKFYLPTKKDIDKRLLTGSAIFGLGWGWAGICPGPGLVSLVSGQASIFVFVAAMMVGMGLFKLIEKRLP